MSKITAEQNEKAYYRQRILHDKMLDLENLISGKGQSYLPLILGEDGKTSPEKLDAFISDMLESFDHYIELNPDRTVDDNTREMYRRFLYCAVMLLKYKPNERVTFLDIKTYSQSYADIIKASEDVDLSKFDSYHDFLMDWYERYHDSTRAFFSYSMDIYTGSHFADRVFKGLSEAETRFKLDGIGSEIGVLWEFFELLPHDTRIQICKDYAKENSISDDENAKTLAWLEDPVKARKEKYERNKKNREQQRSEEERKSEEALLAKYEEEHKDDETYFKALDSIGEEGSYDDNEVLRNLSPEQRKEYEIRKAVRDENDETAYFLNNILIDGHELFNKFIEFAELYYKTRRYYFQEDIKNMVETYLFEHKISAFSFGDYYGLITYQLDRAQSRVKSEIERVRYK